MPDLSGDVKKRRAAEIIALGQKMGETYAESLVGSECEVLLEQAVCPGVCEGYNERYLHCEVPGEAGEICRVRIDHIQDGRGICQRIL